MVAVIVIVTEVLACTTPSQVTVLAPTVAVAVPLVAEAETNISAAGSTSVNSWPGLSC